jgi:hypothetical protein
MEETNLCQQRQHWNCPSLNPREIKTPQLPFIFMIGMKMNREISSKQKLWVRHNLLLNPNLPENH